ncbi:hypothetical protein [Plantactinospora sp. KLBMP9567]|uniref:hypothetical protein n=1 Tax=Plantactinospora sp. KLBMP9567 TaxID=3085900 RepID=UPI002980FCF8|nr:hypothetical protein [Plantactinospora sp. KLBMP9567]MDW5323749.1 hypothetical protein [Plantactinospora sp. KLBMP9567]MDW5326869.1 hypothetical protein [Plantactinospora sp. KLBMP9567]
MIWLAWRQQRFPFTAAAVLTAIYGALATAAHFDTEFTTITQLFAGYLTIGVCMFWGVPLVARDIEHGTHRLAWTQSQPRTRWLAARLTVAAAGALAAATAVTAIVSWALPTTAADPMHWFYYESHDLVPFARVLFALALGAALGALTRNTHIAMAISVPILGIVQLGGARALRESATMTYWQLQLAEAAIYLIVAVALTTVTFLAVQRRP